MSTSDFELLLNLVGPKIYKKDTRLRKAIPIKDRLALTLRFLATGDSYTSLQYLFKISKQRIGVIVIETCQALARALKEHIQLPSTSQEWLQVSKQFEEKWDFPHCLGAMDGKHVILQAPFNTGSDYYNYKNNFSIVLFAVADANYNFIFIDVGCQGRISDGGVFKHTSFNRKLNNGDLNIPQECPLPGMSKPMPYVFLGDEAFPLTNYIMKPFPGLRDKGTIERTFNYRLSRARRTIENVFGIASAVFRVLRKPLLLQPEKATIVVTTICYIHNFLRRNKTSRNMYTPPGTFDQETEDGHIIEGHWREEGTSSGTSLIPFKAVPRKSTMEAQEIRNEFAQFFLRN